MIDFVSDGRDTGKKVVRKTFSRGFSNRNGNVDWDEFLGEEKKEALCCFDFERYCASGCGTKLSIYNKQSRCYLCQKKVIMK